MKILRLLILFVTSFLLIAGCSDSIPEETEHPVLPNTPDFDPAPATLPPVETPAPPWAEKLLTDFSFFLDPADFENHPGLPDVFTMLSGKPVETDEDFQTRMQEIRDLYQYYIYGFWPDHKKETVTYDFDGYNLEVTIEANGNKSSFSAIVSIPDTPAPQGGYPVIISLSFSWGNFPFGHGIPYQFALDNGYAVISYNTPMIAADDASRTGAFYELYPYDKENVFEQTGTLMAWGWGGSKIIDALENGLGSQIGADTEKIVITGVSRYGKAAFVAGAFDERIAITMPACSGAGGASLYRYNPSGNIYDFSSIGGPSEVKAGAPERLDNLQNGFPWWFNDTYKAFKKPEQLPIDQHMQAVLCSTGGRSLFIVSESDNSWIGPAATHATFTASLDVFNKLDIAQQLAINLHWEGHAVLVEDLEKALPFCDYRFFSEPLPFDFSETLQTTVFDLEVNVMDDLTELLGR